MAGPEEQTKKTSELVEPRKQKRPIIEILDTPDAKRRLEAVAGQYMTADRMLRLAINAIRRTPKLAMCTSESVLGSIMICTNLQLEPNTVLGHAYLIPYRQRAKGQHGWYTFMECQLQIGYRGFVELMHRNPKLVVLQAGAVHTKDEFEAAIGSEWASGVLLRWKMARGDRGPLDGAFCFTRMRNEWGAGDAITALNLEEIHKVRAKSEAWRGLTARFEAAEAAVAEAGDKATAKLKKDLADARVKLAETPWVMWEDQMAAKTALKRHAKQAPISPMVAAAANLDSLSEAGILDVPSMTEPEVVRGVVQEGEEPPHVGEESDDLPGLEAPKDDKPKRGRPKKAAKAEEEEKSAEARPPQEPPKEEPPSEEPPEEEAPAQAAFEEVFGP